MATTDAPPPAPATDAEPPRPRRWVQVGLVLAAILLGLGIIVSVPWLRHSFVLCAALVDAGEWTICPV